VRGPASGLDDSAPCHGALRESRRVVEDGGRTDRPSRRTLAATPTGSVPAPPTREGGWPTWAPTSLDPAALLKAGWTVHSYHVHPVCGLSLEGRNDVAVGVHRQADLGVAQGLHDHPSWNALREHEAGSGVAEIMEPKPGQACPLERRLEPPRDIPGVERGANGGREDEVRLPPARANSDPLLQLPRAMGAEGAGHGGRHRDRPSTAPGLRLDELEASIHPLQRLGDAERAGFDVNVRPAEAQDLALAQPQRDRDRVESLEEPEPLSFL
jgi:hypothetical protein